MTIGAAMPPAPSACAGADRAGTPATRRLSGRIGEPRSFVTRERAT
ncbi:MAG: hypothetical protein IOC80_01835 [Rhodobacter sp.]|nr:hypothetical protein [Rhodobacter sp.]MCA3525196.1 hypothetical protein [Rhodobacter sp.]MCA3530308.1 hypothetical protein [Rhodobacter sp.]MCA3532039.1 hypothetical protein [Rhodobacter sp.]MCA3533802.1 hypothetical protein [Rhodobacter sp.]